MIKKITVSMLGNLTVKVDSQRVVTAEDKVTKPWQLFCFLLLNRGKIVSSNTLLDVVWQGEELIDPANVLKNTIYSLRKELCGGRVSPNETPVVFRNDGYCLNNHIKFIVDTDGFIEQCDKAMQMPADDTAARIEALTAAYELYTGDFLAALDNEAWTVPYSRMLRSHFLEVADALCEMLEAGQNWQRVLTISSHASLVDPYNQTCALHMFRALQGLQMHRAIVTSYSKLSRFFAEELNIQLCDEIENIHAAAEARIDRIEQDMLTIQQDLIQLNQSQAHIKGAFYCNYETFRRMYLLLARTAQRSGENLALMLVNVQDHKARVPVLPQLSPAMNTLENVISSCLRRSDVFCRYTKSQYVVLLPTSSLENAEVVVERMKKSFTESVPKLQLTCKLSLIDTNIED